MDCALTTWRRIETCAPSGDLDYNGSVDPTDRLLAFRRATLEAPGRIDRIKSNRILLARYHPNRAHVITEQSMDVVLPPGAAAEQFEDPRIYRGPDGGLEIQMSCWRRGANAIAVGHGPLDLDRGLVFLQFSKYGLNLNAVTRVDASGVVLIRPGAVVTSQGGRPGIEKNWMPFSYGGGRYAVYSVEPFTVIELDGKDGRRVSEVAWDRPPGLRAGDFRGSTPPVLVDGLWWCFVHDHVGLPGRRPASRRNRHYRVWALCFSGDPASGFYPVAISRMPVVRADDLGVPRPRGFHSCLFPGAALCTADSWTMVAGLHDSMLVRLTLDRWAILDLMAEVSVSFGAAEVPCVTP